MNKACDKTYFLQFHDTDGCKSLQSKKKMNISKCQNHQKMCPKIVKKIFLVS